MMLPFGTVDIPQQTVLLLGQTTFHITLQAMVLLVKVIFDITLQTALLLDQAINYFLYHRCQHTFLFRHNKVQGSQRDNYQGKINRRAHSFVQLTQNSIHITQRRPDRLKHILNSWKMLTRDQGILSVGYKIPVSTRARQKKIP